MTLPKKFLTLLALLLWLTLPGPLQAQGDLPDAPAPRPLPGLDVIVLVDESETMWHKTDTEGVRVNTVDFLIDMLAAEQSSQPHRLGLVAFGSEPAVIPFTRLDSLAAAARLKDQFAGLHRQIEAKKESQYTDLNQALTAALELLAAEYDPARKVAVILISDGQPTTPQVAEKQGRAVVEGYLEETQRLLAQFEAYRPAEGLCANDAGVPFYTIGMGVDKLSEVSTPEFIALYREFWQGVAAHTNGYYREAGRLQEMQGISTYIFSELLCVPATPPVTLRSAQVLDYQVYDSYYQIIFTISGKENPGLEARIYRPTAAGGVGEVALRPNDEGVSWQSGPDYEVWRVRYTEPWAGPWRVTLEGEGQAEFSYIVFPDVTIALEQPSSGIWPADKALSLQARLNDEQGQPVDLPIVDFWVEIEGLGRREQVSLTRQGDTFTAQLDPLGQTGELSLTFSTVLPNGTPIFEHKWLTLISAPWVEVPPPPPEQRFEPGAEIPLEAEVHLAGAIPLDGVKLTATLAKDGQPVQTIELSRGETVGQDDEERRVAYAGSFAPPAEPGDYTVQTKMVAVLPGGRVFDNQAGPFPLSLSAPVAATPRPSPTALPTRAAPAPANTATTAVLTPTAQPSPTRPVEATPTPETAVAQVLPSPTPPAKASVWPLPGVTWQPLTPTDYLLPGLLLLLFLLLLLLLLLLLRRRRGLPDRLKLLAELMESRRLSGEPPYLLVLGSGEAMTSGNRTMRQVIEAIAPGPDAFQRTLDGFSSSERYVMLKKHFDQAKLSPAYRRLAELVAQGYFSLIFTTNLDPFLENALAQRNGSTPDHTVVVFGQQPRQETMETLGQAEPPVKIVKLHGDIRARDFAVTPSEISHVGSNHERILRHYLNQDLILIGPGPRDYDLNRAIDREGGAIWYVNESPPPSESPIYRAMRERGTEANVIDGEFGRFDRFFEALTRELKRLRK